MDEHTDSGPIFIGGMYKSGTSLLRAMVGQHSRLFAGLETQWFFESWSEDEDGSQEEKRRWLERLSIFFKVPLEELSAACTEARTVETALECIMGKLTEQASKSRWVEKTPGNVGVIDRILDSWPEARIIHVIRDPRDVYASLVESDKWTDPEEYAVRWRGTVGAGRAWFREAGERRSAYYEIRYERLVHEPHKEMQKLMAFLGERWEPGLDSFSGRPQDFRRVRRATGKESSTLRRLSRPLTTDRVRIWPGVVTEERWNEVLAALERKGMRSLAERLVRESDEIAHEFEGGEGKECRT